MRAKVRGARRGAAAFDVGGWARRFVAGVAMALDAQAAEEEAGAAGARMHVVLGSAAAAAAASVTESAGREERQRAGEAKVRVRPRL